MFEILSRWRQARRLKGLDPAAQRRWQARIDALPILAPLTAPERDRLVTLGWCFLHDKRFTPVDEAPLTAEDCIDIALQAALPVLNLSLEHYGHFHELLIYPEEFLSPRHYVDDNGVEHQGVEELTGEAWEQGPVLLSMSELAYSGSWDGFNLVIHELAHKLDIANGGLANGHPDLPPALRQPWLAAFPLAYAEQCERVNEAERTDRWDGVWLDPYGCENEAEFFAVCVEAFFTDPIALNTAFGELYALLKAYFGQDPLPRAPQWCPYPRIQPSEIPTT
ncbi:zinc-dependent peptidase [Ferrimonas balearica]|uniref:M90 family metallopeptidase n=1 Tax=Ferrimonas balearica TaxID=44012 RepID=UPI001C9A29B5|nr:M90 family metallopeptidase [Ferrimonas balearica]MBY5991517.1 zinc-dependent peptidase [Ferrimonas balearica]